MRSPRTALLVAMLVGITTAHADVTLTQQLEGNAAFIDVGGQSITQIKGKRQRSEQAFNGKPYVAVIDVDGRRIINIDDKKQTALVTPLDVLGDVLKKGGTAELKASLNKTA